MADTVSNPQSRRVSARRFSRVQSLWKKNTIGISEIRDPSASRLQKVMALRPIT